MRGRGSTASIAARAWPLRETMPDSASSPLSTGTPSTERGIAVQRAAGPDARLGGRRVHDPVPETGAPGQLDALGTPVEDRLGADVDGDPGDLAEAQLAADLR